jgi:hypothetical protein
LGRRRRRRNTVVHDETQRRSRDCTAIFMMGSKRLSSVVHFSFFEWKKENYDTFAERIDEGKGKHKRCSWTTVLGDAYWDRILSMSPKEHIQMSLVVHCHD